MMGTGEVVTRYEPSGIPWRLFFVVSYRSVSVTPMYYDDTALRVCDCCIEVIPNGTPFRSGSAPEQIILLAREPRVSFERHPDGTARVDLCLTCADSSELFRAITTEAVDFLH